MSELIGLKWRCIHDDSITIEERYCQGDWPVPKTDASAATIGVEKQVIARLLRLKDLTVEVRAGRSVRKYKLVKSAGPDDLVFQSVKGGYPMNDQNILKTARTAGGGETRITIRQLAVPAYIARDLVGSGWSRSKERAGPNAA